MKDLPALQFVTGISHVAGLGQNVVISFSGFEHGDGPDRSFPTTHRLVIPRAELAQGLEFLQKWLAGEQIEETRVMQ